jgi:hypothetical protein
LAIIGRYLKFLPYLAMRQGEFLCAHGMEKELVSSIDVIGLVIEAVGSLLETVEHRTSDLMKLLLTSLLETLSSKHKLYKDANSSATTASRLSRCICASHITALALKVSPRVRSLDPHMKRQLCQLAMVKSDADKMTRSECDALLTSLVLVCQDWIGVSHLDLV